MNTFHPSCHRKVFASLVAPLGLLMTLLLSGCQGMPERQAVQSNAAEDILKTLDQSLQTTVTTAAHSPSSVVSAPKAVSDALLPEVPMQLGRPEGAPQQRFDLDTVDTPIQVFYMSLVKGTPYNMVVHPSLQGKVSLHLKNVTGA